MNDLDWLELAAGEQVLWSSSPRLTSALFGVLGGVLVSAIAIALALTVDTRLAALSVGAIAVAAWSYVVVINTRFIITSMALYTKSGVIGCRVHRVPLDRVQNSSFSQGIRGRFLGYGSVDVETAGGPGLRFFNIESPRKTRRFVDNRTERFADEVPGTIEQWEAVLSEVKALRAMRESP